MFKPESAIVGRWREPKQMSNQWKEIDSGDTDTESQLVSKLWRGGKCEQFHLTDNCSGTG